MNDLTIENHFFVQNIIGNQSLKCTMLHNCEFSVDFRRAHFKFQRKYPTCIQKYMHFMQRWYSLISSLQWRHNERDGVSNHQRLECLLNRLFRRRSKKTSELRFTGLSEGNPPVTGRFPSQGANNAEKISIWWRHDDTRSLTMPGPKVRLSVNRRQFQTPLDIRSHSWLIIILLIWYQGVNKWSHLLVFNGM